MRQKITLRPMELGDLRFVVGLRNHTYTRHMLHDNNHFSWEQAKRWFLKTSPRWYMVYGDSPKPIGYVRTSTDDCGPGQIMVGMDIVHTQRRRGVALAAYRQLFAMLASDGFNEARLEVISSNLPAISLYRKLGFECHGIRQAALFRGNVWLDSVCMHRPIGRRPLSGVNCKVLVVYLGSRRSPPSTAESMQRMVDRLLSLESTVDPGCPMNTHIVCNYSQSDYAPQDSRRVRQCVKALMSIDGSKTPGGIVEVTFRENLGISFGAYSEAYSRWRGLYDNWMFVEDDCLMPNDGYYARAVERLRDTSVGFVAMVGLSKPHYRHHAAGSVGVAPHEALEDVLRQAPSLPWDPIHGYARGGRWFPEMHVSQAVGELGYAVVKNKHDDVERWSD